MNIAIAIVGALLIAVAAIRGMMAYDADFKAGKIPRDGDVQIRKEGESIWIYKYVSHPGWQLSQAVSTMDEAREIKRRADARRGAVEEVVE